MSHAARRPRKNVEDYLALPDDARAELIDGELYVTPSPTFAHQAVIGRLHARLLAHVEGRGLGLVGLSPLDVHLSSEDVVQPDILFVAAERKEICRRWVYGPPDLAVEVVSPTHPERDRIVKRGLYAKHGVPEFWIVDPETRSIEVLRLGGGVYQPAGWFREGETVRTPTWPDLELHVEDVFA